VSEHDGINEYWMAMANDVNWYSGELHACIGHHRKCFQTIWSNGLSRKHGGAKLGL